MKKIVAALALGAIVAVAGTAAEAKDWKKIRIATEGAYAPWNATDPSGKLIGFEPDLALELCKRIKAECEIVAQDWDGMIPAIQQGKYDAIMAAMSITDEREKVIAFAGPYGTEPSMFGTMKNSPLAKATFPGERYDLSKDDPKAAIAALADALKGKTVGVQTSTIQANFMEKLLPQVAVRTYDKLDNAGIDMAAGRVDAIFGDRSAVDAILKADAGNGMTLFGPAFARGVLGKGVGVGLRKADGDLKELFNKAIAEANQDGTITKLSTQHFGYDISIK
ncbi:amino acid ABC transporter substrate-binding protein [Azospirillum baldaniorum]|uniref:Lysine/arginine/ornithine ABC transporter periplasmic-binding component n=1 Tax=Azospirillum baldaniorum TaxID=1064539 RepID=A0A9P1JMT1_9PROT|nr:transporter substrate-binding domain-containing protein [Azospirillum baldaniorum]AWJ88674.1 amino acid ABC transporter substrate-binding protein [Azospirillum baldaniorum]NUB06608.1 transporter substrate-binding domain-containing protein [Azospirillum baldaniorum]TWA79789.1 octopine/nopaline transport system substrate-binding protein [Azospirillum brasilense]CCC96354.1 lysine/arginine/ornithine ABC transporter; periplasmic-binding component [Azospirillum baldaniorum]